MTDKEKLDAIRAEIHRLVDVRGYDRGMANDLFAFMDSLPNEPISKDLEKEIDSIWNPRFHLGWDEKSLLSINHGGFTSIAKHFFELGLKAKGE